MFYKPPSTTKWTRDDCSHTDPKLRPSWLPSLRVKTRKLFFAVKMEYELCMNRDSLLPRTSGRCADSQTGAWGRQDLVLVARQGGGGPPRGHRPRNELQFASNDNLSWNALSSSSRLRGMFVLFVPNRLQCTTPSHLDAEIRGQG